MTGSKIIVFVKDADCPIGILNFFPQSSYNGATTKAIFNFKRRLHNATSKDEKSISVPEMGRILGLGKVESYWLVKKNYFTTIQVAGHMRVMLDSSTIRRWMAHPQAQSGGTQQCAAR